MNKPPLPAYNRTRTLAYRLDGVKHRLHNFEPSAALDMVILDVVEWSSMYICEHVWGNTPYLARPTHIYKSACCAVCAPSWTAEEVDGVYNPDAEGKCWRCQQRSEVPMVLYEPGKPEMVGLESCRACFDLELNGAASQ